MYFHRNELYNLIDNSFFTITCFVFLIKMLIMFLKQKKIEQLLKRLKNPIFIPSRREHFAIVKKSANYAKLNSAVFLTMCLLTCVWWIIFPLVDVNQVATKNLIIELLCYLIKKIFFCYPFLGKGFTLWCLVSF